jgi:hypothetical protein
MVTLCPAVRHTVCLGPAAATKNFEEKPHRVEPSGSAERMMSGDRDAAHIFALNPAHKNLNSCYEFDIKPDSSYRALAGSDGGLKRLPRPLAKTRK